MLLSPGVLGDKLLPCHAGDTGDDRKARRKAIGAGRHVTLPATPHHGEAAPHQKAVAGMLGVSTLRRPVEPRHDRLVAAIGHVVDEAPIAAIEIKRLQDPEIALILDEAQRVARGPIEVDDSDIQGMCRVEFAEYRAVQPFIRPDSAEFRAIKHGPFPFGHLDPQHAANAHIVLPTEPAIGGSLATSQGRRKRAPFLPRPWRIPSDSVALTPSVAASRTAATGETVAFTKRLPVTATRFWSRAPPLRRPTKVGT